MYIQIGSRKILLLAWLCTDAGAVAWFVKSLWVFMYIADANLLSFLYKQLNVTIFKHSWLPSLPCACFFVVFSWHPWSSCTLKVKKSLCVAQFTHSHCCPFPCCVRVCGMATALLYSVSFWKLSNFLHCRTSWGDLYCYGWYYSNYCWGQLRFGLGNYEARLGFSVRGHSRLHGWILT